MWIHAFPSYDGIDAEKYIEWETKIYYLFLKLLYVWTEKDQKGN